MKNISKKSLIIASIIMAILAILYDIEFVITVVSTGLLIVLIALFISLIQYAYRELKRK